MLPRDVALWAGKAGTTRRRLLDALVGAAQERESLEVEETLERLAEAVGLQSAGTVWERIGELERAGWLVRLVTGRKGQHGSVWRLQVPPRLRTTTSRRHLIPSANRDIKKEFSDLRLFGYRVVEEFLTPRLTAPMERVQTTPTAKPAAMEEPPAAPSADCRVVPASPRPSRARQRPGKPRSSRVVSTPRQAAPVGSGVDLSSPAPAVWAPADYLTMRDAVTTAAGGAWPGLCLRTQGQVKAATRRLLGAEFTPADVTAAVARVGRCAPMRLVVVLTERHVDLGPRQRAELAPGPVRELIAALAASLPALDKPEGRPDLFRQGRDLEREARDEVLAVEAERTRQLAALMPPVSRRRY